jgi:transcriptional regulator with XRE-family HTH domain
MESASNFVIHKIGAKIRTYRKAKKLRVLDLANASGISSAMVSKIENGRIIPTIPTLFEIIRVLKVEPEDFFAGISNNQFAGYLLIRQEDYVPYVKEENAIGFNYRSILEHHHKGSAFQISIVELLPNSSRPQVTTAAFEYLYVIQGEIAYHLGDKVFDLRTGDSIFFDGNIPHVPMNPTSEKVIYLVLYLFIE